MARTTRILTIFTFVMVTLLFGTKQVDASTTWQRNTDYKGYFHYERSDATTSGSSKNGVSKLDILPVSGGSYRATMHSFVNEDILDDQYTREFSETNTKSYYYEWILQVNGKEYKKYNYGNWFKRQVFVSDMFNDAEIKPGDQVKAGLNIYEDVSKTKQLFASDMTPTGMYVTVPSGYTIIDEVKVSGPATKTPDQYSKVTSVCNFDIYAQGERKNEGLVSGSVFWDSDYIDAEIWTGWSGSEGGGFPYGQEIKRNYSLELKDGYLFAMDDASGEEYGGSGLPYETEISSYKSNVSLWAIETVNLTPVSVKLSTSSYTYNGKVKSPKVSVVIKDSSGKTMPTTEYSVKKPAGRKNIGSYTYKVTFKNQHIGSINLVMKVNPKGTTQYTPGRLKRGFKVRWKKRATKMPKKRIAGYQVQYSLSNKMTSPKYKRFKGYWKTSGSVTKLKAGKKYYVRVRTYFKVGTKYYYSKWSKIKAVRTKY